MAVKGVVIEFDFAAMNGADLLFGTTKKFLEELDGIGFDTRTEAKYLAGAKCQDGLSRLFATVKTKKTAQKAARDLQAAFAAAVTAAIPRAVTVAFTNFVRALTEKGVRVVLLTQADEAAARVALASVLNASVSLYADAFAYYGTMGGSAWLRACRFGGLTTSSTLAITGSGFGVRSALLAGMGSVAVTNEHVAYQDFGGADAVIDELSGKTVKKVLEKLRV